MISIKRLNRNGFEFSFAWIFAILVGAVILFLAIYGTTKIVKTERQVVDTTTVQKLGVLFTPLETGSEDIKDPGKPIKLTSETRVYNDCYTSGMFGKQEISLASRSGFGNEWEKPGNPVVFANKYIFSEEIVQSDEFYVFSKPFEMPFKVADVIYFWTGEYCFVNAPNKVKDEIENLEFLSTLINFTTYEKCGSDSKKVCFGGSGGKRCEVEVFDSYVRKDGKIVYYGSLDSGTGLLYGAIFSSPEIYECQLKRLMMRTSELAVVQQKKTAVLSQSSGECNFDVLFSPLNNFANITDSFNSSVNLGNVLVQSSEIGRLNNAITGCQLF